MFDKEKTIHSQLGVLPLL